MSDVVKTRSDVTFIIFFFTALTIVGLVAGGFFVRDYARARASEAWPVVEGVVLSKLDDSGAAVRYAYSFDGHSYEGTRERVFSAQLFRADQTSYLPGERISVYVSPVEPSYAVLIPGGAGTTFILFSLLSGVCLFLGVGGMVWTLSDGVAPLNRNPMAHSPAE